MSARREKHKRLQERALKAERENARLAELLLLHKPPLRCRIRAKVCHRSPSAAMVCTLGVKRPNKKRACKGCRGYIGNSARLGFEAGITGKPYQVVLADEVKRIYGEA